jgi:glutamyl-tRNA synthetase
MPFEKFHEKAIPWIRKAMKRQDIDLEKISKPTQTYTEKFTDIAGQLDFMDVLPSYSSDLYVSQKMKTDKKNALQSLETILPIFESITEWDFNTLHGTLFDLIKKRE